MKKEKYFRDELQHMFIYYAIVPAVVFTLLCGVVFMVALIHGRRSITVSNNGYVAGELERVLGRYEEGLVRLAGQPDLFTGTLDTRRKAGIFEGFYGMTNGLEIKGNLYILDRDRNILLSSQPGRPEYLDVKEGTSWGIFWHMDRWPGQTAVKLVDGWKSQQGAVALGRSVESEGQTVGYVVCSIPSSQMQKMLDRLETQTIITDSYGWVYACSNYHFVNKSNQVLGALSRQADVPGGKAAGLPAVVPGLFHLGHPEHCDLPVLKQRPGHNGADPHDPVDAAAVQEDDGKKDRGLLPYTGCDGECQDRQPGDLHPH